MSTISISGLNKAHVLAALYNASRPQGLGFRQYDPKPMTPQDAEVHLARQTSFDYLSGRVMKIDLSSDDVYIGSYDRDNGQGAAKRAVDALRETGDTNAKQISDTHASGTDLARKELQRPGAMDLSVVPVQQFFDQVLRNSKP